MSNGIQQPVSAITGGSRQYFLGSRQQQGSRPSFLPAMTSLASIQAPVGNVVTGLITQLATPQANKNIHFEGARGNTGQQGAESLDGMQLARGVMPGIEVIPEAGVGGGGQSPFIPQTGVGETLPSYRYTQPFIDNAVQRLSREITQVRPDFQFAFRDSAKPYDESDIAYLNGEIAKLRGELISQLRGQIPEMVLRDMPLLALNDQFQYRAYRANGGRAGFKEWITEKPLSLVESRLASDRTTPVRTLAQQGNYQPSHMPGFGDKLDSRLPVRQNNGPTQGVVDINGEEIYLTSGVQGPGQRWYDPQMPPRSQFATHVEGHAAALMVSNGIASMTVTINHRDGPCHNCLSKIPNVLPIGSTLTVKWMDKFDVIHTTPIMGKQATRK